MFDLDAVTLVVEEHRIHPSLVGIGRMLILRCKLRVERCLRGSNKVRCLLITQITARQQSIFRNPYDSWHEGTYVEVGVLFDGP